MKLDDYLLMIRKQARRGLAREIKCTVHVDEEGNVLPLSSDKTVAVLNLGILASEPDRIVNSVDIWGHRFGPEPTKES